MMSCTKNSPPSLTNAVYLLRITTICCSYRQNCVEKAAILLYLRVVNDVYILPRKVAQCNIEESFYGD